MCTGIGAFDQLEIKVDASQFDGKIASVVGATEDALERFVRIMVLADELRGQARLNTATSRERCRTISTELLELFKIEDAYHLNHSLFAASKSVLGH
jgi:hypothetical protein